MKIKFDSYEFVELQELIVTVAGETPTSDEVVKVDPINHEIEVDSKILLKILRAVNRFAPGIVGNIKGLVTELIEIDMNIGKEEKK